MSQEFRPLGGCQIVKEAVRLARPFGVIDMQMISYHLFLARIEAEEVQSGLGPAGEGATVPIEMVVASAGH